MTKHLYFLILLFAAMMFNYPQPIAGLDIDSDCPDPQVLTINNADQVEQFHIIEKDPESWVDSIAVDSSGSRAAVGDKQGIITLVNIDELDIEWEIEAHSFQVNELAFNPNDPFELASASPDRTIKIWNVETGEILHVFEGFEGAVSAITYHPERNLLVSASGKFFAEDTISVWDTDLAEQVSQMRVDDREIIWLAFAPTGSRVVSGDYSGTVRVWDFPFGGELAAFDTNDNGLNAVAIDPRGDYLATAGFDEMVTVWDAQTYELLTHLTGYEDEIYSLVFSPDSSMLVSGDGDGVVRMWRTDTWHQIVEIEAHPYPVMTIAFDPDGRYFLTGSTDGTVRFWGVCGE